MNAADTVLRLNASWVDYSLVALYFVFVLGIGWAAKSKVSSSIDFFLSGRGLPAWVTGLAFISANLGAVEIVGHSANGVQYGFQTMHYFWIGAVPAMVFLGIVMMPFYYGSKVRSVPEFMLRRFGSAAHLVNALSFAIAQLLIAGVSLLLLAKVVNSLLGWPMWLTLLIAAIIVLSYITLGGLSAAIYNEVLQFFVIVAGLFPLTIIGLNRVGGWSGLKERVATESHFHTWPGTDISGFANPAWALCLAWASCCPSVTGPLTSWKFSVPWQLNQCRPRVVRPSSAHSPRCLFRSLWLFRAWLLERWLPRLWMAVHSRTTLFCT